MLTKTELQDENIKELLEKYKSKIKKELGVEIDAPKAVTSREYKEFKKEIMPPHLSLYEKACNFCEKIIRIKLNKKREEELQESINICHLNTTPSGVFAFSIIAPVLLMIFGSLVSLILFEGFFFVFSFILAAIILIGPLGKLPDFLANSWRMKASNQMVLCIFYVVTYMRHTSNLELAIEFASEHLAAPLSLDLKKVLWDIETETYESIKESLDIYLETWRKWNLEFIESFHLIESSLYEGSEDRRLSLLDKSLDVILEETYEKMLHYAQNLKSPITMLHMMGIILPILGLVILPLVVSFMENVKWYYIATLYDIALPIGVYYLGREILSKRPTGYGETDISEENPELKKYRNLIINIAGIEIEISPLYIAILIGAAFFLIGLSPIIMHILNPYFDIPITQNFSLLEYRESSTVDGLIVGPFGLGASILSLFVPLSFGISMGLFFRLRSKNVIKIREQSKKLEQEFASALFQLGNRLGDGLPAEIAFGKVASVMEGTISGNFFQIVSMNIRKLGMGVKQAIFSPKLGALVYFPSNLIESSMKVLIESVKKGPQIAAQALMNVSRYIKEMHRVDERLKDLMSDIISSMRSQISFLTPVIAGIVIGITSMITYILGKLGSQMATMSANIGAGGGVGAAANLATLFGDGIPTYFFQIVVGIYVVEIVYILTVLANGIENGADKLSERYDLGVNLIRSTILYCIVSLAVILIFNIIAGRIMASTIGVA